MAGRELLWLPLGVRVLEQEGPQGLAQAFVVDPLGGPLAERRAELLSVSSASTETEGFAPSTSARMSSPSAWNVRTAGSIPSEAAKGSVAALPGPESLGATRGGGLASYGSFHSGLLRQPLFVSQPSSLMHGFQSLRKLGSGAGGVSIVVSSSVEVTPYFHRVLSS